LIYARRPTVGEEFGRRAKQDLVIRNQSNRSTTPRAALRVVVVPEPGSATTAAVDVRERRIAVGGTTGATAIAALAPVSPAAAGIVPLPLAAAKAYTIDLGSATVTVLTAVCTICRRRSTV